MQLFLHVKACALTTELSLHYWPYQYLNANPSLYVPQPHLVPATFSAVRVPILAESEPDTASLIPQGVSVLVSDGRKRLLHGVPAIPMAVRNGSHTELSEELQSSDGHDMAGQAPSNVVNAGRAALRNASASIPRGGGPRDRPAPLPVLPVDDEPSETDSYHDSADDEPEDPSECVACRSSLRNGRASYCVLFKGREQGPWCCSCVIRHANAETAWMARIVCFNEIESLIYMSALIRARLELRHAYGTRTAERPPRRSRNPVGGEKPQGSSTTTPDDVREVPQGTSRVTLGPISGAGPEPGMLVYRWILYHMTKDCNRT